MHSDLYFTVRLKSNYADERQQVISTQPGFQPIAGNLNWRSKIRNNMRSQKFGFSSLVCPFLAVVSFCLTTLVAHIFGELGLFHVLIHVLFPPALLLAGLVLGLIGIFRDENPLSIGLIINGLGLLICVFQGWIFLKVVGGP